MKLRQPWLISSLAAVLARKIRLHGATVRYILKPMGRPLLPCPALGSQRYIYAAWHETLMPPAFLYRDQGVRVLVSKHSDGDFAAKTINRLGFATTRGSTNRGGMEAVRELMALNNADHLVFPVDGPRGPRRHVQPGAIYVSSRTQMPIVCVGIGFSSCWRCKSWDRFAIPKPLSKVVFVTSDPIVVPRDADREVLKHYHARVQRELDMLSARADRLAAGEKLELRAAA